MRRAFVIALAALAASAGLATRAIPARAGTLTAFANSSNCGLLVPVTNVGGLAISNYSWDCSTLVISNVNEGTYPTNSYGQLISYAPAGIAITSATVTGAVGDEGAAGTNWWTGSIWNGGGQTWNTYLGSTANSFPGGSSYWGMQMWCLWSICAGGSISASTVTLTAVENRAPGLTAQGDNNIWWQSQRYIWNPPDDPWPMQMASTDPSGTCYITARVGNFPLASPVWPKNQYSWQQCPNPLVWTPNLGAQIDTRSYVATAGDLPVSVTAWNAAGVPGSVAETLKIDNDPVRVTLSHPDDPDVQQWVNHPVSVAARATAGPSGVGGQNCSIDGAKAQAYPADGVAVNGDGIHRVTCTAWNNAVDPQGAHQTGSTSESVAIDEAPPAVAFEPQDPTDPTKLTVNTSDRESGVAGGSVQIARAGTQDWTSLPTALASGHLISRFDDSHLRGAYVLRATGCDDVGNCAATDQTLTMPLRLTTRSAVSFQKIESPAKVVHERVRVGWHYKRVRRHGKVHRVRVGGRERTIRVIIPENTRCASKRVRTGPHRWRELRVCRAMKLKIVSQTRVAHGKATTVHGLLVTSQGAPLADSPVRILTAPDNRLRHYTPLRTVTTGLDGTWSVTLPAGPSRTIKAVYGGSPYVLGATGSAATAVPARIALSITPRQLPWQDFIRVRGRLEGGYVPPDGLALRFLVRYPHSKRPTSVLPLRTDAHGQFSFTWSFNGGNGTATYPMWMATTANESDYPFTAAASSRIPVTWGAPTPPRQRHRPHHRQRVARGAGWQKPRARSR